MASNPGFFHRFDLVIATQACLPLSAPQPLRPGRCPSACLCSWQSGQRRRRPFSQRQLGCPWQPAAPAAADHACRVQAAVPPNTPAPACPRAGLGVQAQSFRVLTPVCRAAGRDLTRVHQPASQPLAMPVGCTLLRLLSELNLCRCGSRTWSSWRPSAGKLAGSCSPCAPTASSARTRCAMACVLSGRSVHVCLPKPGVAWCASAHQAKTLASGAREHARRQPVRIWQVRCTAAVAAHPLLSPPLIAQPAGVALCPVLLQLSHRVRQGVLPALAHTAPSNAPSCLSLP